jgi:hypothetical protein
VALVTGAKVAFARIGISAYTNIDGKERLYVAQKCTHWCRTRNSNAVGTLNRVLKFIFSTVAEKDAYTFSRTFKQPDEYKLDKAMLVETVVHKKCTHWGTLLQKDITKSATPTLSSWSSKRKQIPAGHISKYKAPLCAHAGI